MNTANCRGAMGSESNHFRLVNRTAADDDRVVIVHDGGSVPACSATMYAAYQSGQFGSLNVA